MSYFVVTAGNFDKDVRKLNIPIPRIDRIYSEQQKNPFGGKPLGLCLREKKY